MKSKGDRFLSPGDAKSSKVTAREPGPGAYDAHNYNTIQKFLATKRERMSRQNPGFGASSVAHTLPFEVDINNDQKAFQNQDGDATGKSFDYGGSGGAMGGGASAGGGPRRRQSIVGAPMRASKEPLEG